MIIFKFKQKKFEGDLKIKLSGKRLNLLRVLNAWVRKLKKTKSTDSVKCLGNKTDTSLSWQYHVYDISVKLNRTNALLFKMRS